MNIENLKMYISGAIVFQATSLEKQAMSSERLKKLLVRKV
jgi:hypothetical protein